MPTDVYFYACTTCGASGPDAKVNGAPTTYACDVPQYGPFHCPKCRPGLVPADECAVVGKSVGLVGADPQALWAVLARNGDRVTLRPQGLPSFPSFEVSLDEISPKFSYQRLEQARREAPRRRAPAR